ncbi:hypothetical protein J4050_13095 [Winogradskyella sp. DF17]|uniref:Uncharacterized protein n=1 Tax=Winogradskyella pelagia TaxID=2819984 RepID=A0ABS3T725_9FLAO|nr:hypothetical protein [Winogradskyella sp. DF17]MBO3117686.1 hypothetical protein [Winogradskyella sp. DF17]
MESFFKKEYAIAIALVFSLFAYSQQTITITLMVDTQSFNPETPLASCSLKAEYSRSGEVLEAWDNLENFTVPATVDDNIVWEGMSTSSGRTRVDIAKIQGENDSRIFRKRTNYGRLTEVNPHKVVESKILYSTKDKPDYKYSIYFNINNGRDTFKIDPKIKVGTKN